ncbi:C6 transcription factor [Pyrenophora seminiperda CCB06]|uniref:C6 transcription factor n=1 Tax=Pyrenophora seminiperda CCB06 TaxID=1302712 RepID=A0A3M7MCU2_9PLEO|nr:C6 transcription factor [Pyrenophora seminiperda CCB06]
MALPNGMDMSPLKRSSDDADHEDGRRPAPRTPRIRACESRRAKTYMGYNMLMGNQRHKIKCEPVDNENKCAKCLRSGTECVPYNLNQRLLDEDATWKANATAEIQQLRSAVEHLLHHNKLPSLNSPQTEPSPRSHAARTSTISPPNVVSDNGHATLVVPPPMDMTRDTSVERESGEESGLVTAPMRSLYDLTRIRNLRSSARRKPHSHSSVEQDFITQGIIPLAEAEALFQRYMQDLRLYLWAGVLFPYDSLDAVRHHSTLLTAAVLTISALHTPGRDDALQKCYDVFVSLVYNTFLARPHNLDDIRALALAAFYLSNLSWKLAGLAVRNAVEMGLHMSYQKLAREADFQQLRLFNFAIEQWRLSWQARSADSPSIGSYPSKGVVLYYHFARFQLNSLALRALPPPSAATSESLSYDRREAANIAITAATSTLTLIFEEPDLRKAMTAVPIFTHTMVAFSVTFLLKMAQTWGGVAQVQSPEWATEPVGLGLNFNINQVLSLSRRSSSFLAKVAQNLNEKHITRHVVQGIDDLLRRIDVTGRPSSSLSLSSSAAAAVGKAIPTPEPARVFEQTKGAMAAAGGEQLAADPTNEYNMYDLIGSYGFGFDETFLGQVAPTNLDFWQTEPL